MSSQVFRRSCVHCKGQLHDKFAEGLEVHKLGVVFDLLQFVVDLSGKCLNLLCVDKAVQAMVNQKSKDRAWMNRAVSFAVFVEGFQGKSLLLAAVVGKVYPECFFVAAKHVFQPIGISIFL